MNIYDIDESFILDPTIQHRSLLDSIAVRVMLKPPYGNKAVIMRCAGVSCDSCLEAVGASSSVCPVCSSRVEADGEYVVCQGCESKLRICGFGRGDYIVTACSQLIPGFEDKAEDVI